MYAIVEIAGFQFKVEENKTVKIPYLGKEAGETVEVDRVLFLADEKGVEIGQPILEKVKVKAKVLENGKDDKVIVFKKKRRKGYRVKRGHRQMFTTILIEKIEK